MALIGRKREQSILDDCMRSDRAEFVVVYGRRRVGKTFLIKEYFNYRFSFYATGVNAENMDKQLAYFDDSLHEYGSGEEKATRDWREAFAKLKRLLSDENIYKDPISGKKIVFFDEMPWMDTARSDFKSALDYFWNSWGADQKDLILIVCGSATSWIINNILGDKGGFYNRITRQIYLAPFSLSECEQFFADKNIIIGKDEIIVSYMVFGGIPYYLNLFDRRLSLTQNIDALLFAPTGQLYYEFDRLFSSLFRKPQKHTKIINALSQIDYGLTRTEIIEKTGIADGNLLTRAIEELEQCGFIRRYKNYAKNKRVFYFQIIDPFVLFCRRFIVDRKFSSWMKYRNSPGYNAWRGLAFEIVCLNHIGKIKEILGISGIESMDYSWRSKRKAEGAQIDLLIDRSDNVINVCEMKYSDTPYAIDAEYEEKLKQKIFVFEEETQTRKTLYLTMISASGLTHNEHSGIVVNEISGKELF